MFVAHIFHNGKITLKKAEVLSQIKFGRKDKIWLDVVDPSLEELAQVKDRFSLHSLTVEDIYKAATRIKLEEFRKYTFVVLFGLKEKKSLSPIQLSNVLGPNFLLTFEKTRVHSYERLKNNHKRLAYLFEKVSGCALVMHHLLDLEMDRYFPLLDRVDQDLDHVEEKIVSGEASNNLETIFDFKKEVVRAKRIITANRNVISALTKREVKFVSPESRIYFRDVLDHLIRLSEVTDSFRDLITSALEVQLSASSNKMNDIMRVLTIITTIMMPLTVISGIYGMNFEYMPELTSPFGYIGALTLMALTAGGMLLYFKKKKWI